jgi:hypothetical protein
VVVDTYSPVSRPTTHELALYQPTVGSHTSGSWRWSRSSFGPIAWLVNGEPARARR